MPDMHPRAGDRVRITKYDGETEGQYIGPATVTKLYKNGFFCVYDRGGDYTVRGYVSVVTGLDAWEPLTDDPPGDPNTPGLAQLISFAQQLEPDALKVLALLADRLRQGRRTYGDLQLAKDKRDLNKECLDEVLDGLWYAAAGLLKQATPKPKPKRKGCPWCHGSGIVAGPGEYTTETCGWCEP